MRGRRRNPARAAALTEALLRPAVTADLQKERSAKAKLSDLCRELQRQLKASKEEAARTMATEKERQCVALLRSGRASGGC